MQLSGSLEMHQVINASLAEFLNWFRYKDKSVHERRRDRDDFARYHARRRDGEQCVYDIISRHSGEPESEQEVAFLADAIAVLATTAPTVERRDAWMRMLRNVQVIDTRGYGWNGFRLHLATNGYVYAMFMGPVREVGKPGPDESWGAVERYG